MLGFDVAGQRGQVFTRADAHAAGLTDRQISARLRNGTFVALRPGVYAEPDLEGRDELVARTTAALLRLGPDAAASHRTAANLHGLALLGPALSLVDVTRPSAPDRTPDALPGVRALRAGLPDRDVTEVAGLRLTTVARTVFDVARTSSFRAGVVSADSAAHIGLITAGDVVDVAARCRRWPGKRRALEVARFLDPLSESVTESVSRVVIRDGGLPAPRTQVVLGDADGVIGRVDFFWDEGVIGEADGLVKYSGDNPTSLVTEKLRQERLEEAGFIVVRWTWWQLFNEPDRVVARIRRALQRAERTRCA
ncbi:MAG TPA: type IV toxin-antitoxin system AbiEi family antitoxin domain-containing protein [Mycobacteriales bacterium]|nr:type IV toxin-antitoxin system AbiEi family antitoxin domain-containing protein [Mycobacteriales bacterium]